MINEILAAALEEADRLGVHIIGRYQQVRDISATVNNGRTERIVNEETCGFGVQAFTTEGYSGFAASDSPDVAVARELVAKAAQLAELSKEFNGEKNLSVFAAPRVVVSIPSPREYAFDKLGVCEIEARVKQVNETLLTAFAGISVQTIFRQVEDTWSIVRTGGSKADFSMPRAVLVNNITARKNGRSVTTRSTLGGVDVGVLLNHEMLAEGRARGRMMAGLALDLLDAPPVKSGHYKLLIDYALAKGLAHEAFGHAVETDSVRTSILGREGKLATGMQVADPRVSIVDGPIPGDWAYQPVSANGIIRKTVGIVEKGKLAAGLGDLFSATGAGVEVSGAGRAESFAHLPLPRMTNIRIEVENPIPLTKPWHSVTPRELYTLLLDNGLVKPGEEVYYLVGYKGGQVNTQHGDFVFNCSAVYKLGEIPVLHRPGIFAGKTLSALKAIRAGIGPVLTDALGTCGKWGQGVPSSGGSNTFLLLDSSPEITLGGE
ncbi:MAG TPA: TldD/PmbA family protein [Verrucomicrobiae bacterium]|nr:TldD/PmbA family protein [Verrucomicrobiae bacterium]